MNIFTKIKDFITFVHDKITQLLIMIFMLFTQTTPTYAAGIADSTFVKGTLKMINDGASGLRNLAIAGAVLCIIAYGLLKMFADDMEDKGWNKRIRRAIIGCVVVLTASAIVEMFTGYYV